MSGGKHHSRSITLRQVIVVLLRFPSLARSALAFPRALPGGAVPPAAHLRLPARVGGGGASSSAYPQGRRSRGRPTQEIPLVGGGTAPPPIPGTGGAENRRARLPWDRRSRGDPPGETSCQGAASLPETGRSWAAGCPAVSTRACGGYRTPLPLQALTHSRASSPGSVVGRTPGPERMGVGHRPSLGQRENLPPPGLPPEQLSA